jgi:hypothetical protein
MMKRRLGIVGCAVLVMAFVGGCTSAEEDVLGTFICGILRSAPAAYLS